MAILTQNQYDVAKMLSTSLVALALVYHMDRRLDRLEELVLKHFAETHKCQSLRTFEQPALMLRTGKPFSITWPPSAFQGTAARAWPDSPPEP